MLPEPKEIYLMMRWITLLGRLDTSGNEGRSMQIRDRTLPVLCGKWSIDCVLLIDKQTEDLKINVS